MEGKVTVKRRNGSIIEDVSEIELEPFFFSSMARAQVLGFVTRIGKAVTHRGRLLISGSDGKCRLEGFQDRVTPAIEKRIAEGGVTASEEDPEYDDTEEDSEEDDT